MVYKKEKSDKWVNIPVNKDDLDLLRVLLKKEGKTLKDFFQEAVKKYLTGATLIL